MGAGAVSGVTSGVAACSDEDLQKMCKAMPRSERDKLAQAIASAGGAATPATAPAAGSAAAGPAADASPAADAAQAAPAVAAAPAAGSRRFCIGGNWKCNPKTVSEVKDLCSAFKESKFDT